jgi:hypothetical protein
MPDRVAPSWQFRQEKVREQKSANTARNLIGEDGV